LRPEPCVKAGGEPLRARDALVRTLVFSLSFLLFGVGFLLGLIRRDRRELHDRIAGTAVVYAWDASTLAAETRRHQHDIG
jgi:uncharacterized RDD family membrane protein YckC